MTETIVSKVFKVVTDVSNDVWERVSFWKRASDVELEDGSTLEDNKPVGTLTRETSYAVGDVAYEKTAPSWVMLKCTTTGTTASTVPTGYASISSVGTTITDGTAKFIVYDKRPITSNTASDYKIPAASLVNTINNQLTVSGTKFQFAYQSSTGKYGYTVNGTFYPF